MPLPYDSNAAQVPFVALRLFAATGVQVRVAPSARGYGGD